MYTRATKTITTAGTLKPYIDGIDIYNSQFLYQLTDPNLERKLYEINVYEYRPDLIAQDFYGSVEYLPFVILSAGLSLSQFRKGVVLSLITKDAINSITKLN